MISITDNIPKCEIPNAEHIKIKTLYECYHDDNRVIFWTQQKDKAYLAMSDGNLCIYNKDGCVEEISEFVNVICPESIFGDYKTLSVLRPDCKRICVMKIRSNNSTPSAGDLFSSKEIYEMFKSAGFNLPEYPYFAVDLCRRLNHDQANYYGIKDKCAAVSFKTDDYAIINGIASHCKGYGTVALNGILVLNKTREVLVCCEQNLKGFYEKNGFKFCYYAGYWEK